MFWQRKRGKRTGSPPGKPPARGQPSGPYLSYLPEPSEATINLLREVVKRGARIDQFEIELSSLESPSSRLAVERYQLEHYGRVGLSVRIGQLQQPDPRRPRGPVDFVLWRYEGTDPRPAIVPPAEDVALAVAALAAEPFHADRWWELAREVAGALAAGRVNDLLGIMIHPPLRPEALPIWVWVQRVQVAAAFAIAHLGSGWEGSPRRRVLFSLARGPMDWTVEAAIVALAQIARREPSTVRDIAALYLELLESLPTPGGIPYLQALLTCAERLPAPDRTLHDRVDEIQKGLSAFEAGAVVALVAWRMETGSALAADGDHEGAIACFDEVLHLEPDHAEALNARGNVYSQLGEFARAIADYSQALRLDPKDAGIYRNRGIARGRSSDAQGALADFNHAIRLDPGMSDAYSDRGTEYLKMGEYKKAIDDYTVAIQLDPRSALAYSNRAAARCEVGDYDGAITDSDAAIRFDPDRAAAYNNRAYAHLKRGEYESAEIYAQMAIQLRPHGYFYNNRGQARGALGDYSGAVADLREALRLEPRHPEAEDIRAKIAEWSRKT
jgi:tetratricopeptide (TPR) repeat protein